MISEIRKEVTLELDDDEVKQLYHVMALIRDIQGNMLEDSDGDDFMVIVCNRLDYVGKSFVDDLYRILK